jgi:hypothetical protein
MNNSPCLVKRNSFLSFKAASDEAILSGSYLFITFIIFQANVVCKKLKCSGATSVTCCAPRGSVPTNFWYDNIAVSHDYFPSEVFGLSAILE